jgi:hypothetical protein
MSDNDSDHDDDDESDETEVPFALTPAIAIQGIINYQKTSGRKLYLGATAKLDEELYDCKPEGLFQFLQSLAHRAQNIGWNAEDGILMIPDDPADIASAQTYLIDNYGVTTLESIRNFEASYIDRNNRGAQDTNMLYSCLMNSISKEGKTKILIWKSQYTVNDKLSGNLLLKVIIRESHLDTNATTATIRTKLSSLDSYLPTIGSDITKFNGYVRMLIDSLAARGETTQDLLTNLFKGYQAASDKSFVEYIGRKLEKYEEGENITADGLMEQASNKFKLLKVHGKWNAPSQEEEKILALEARVKQLSKTTQKLHPLKKKEFKKKGTRGGKEPASDQPSWFNKEPTTADLHKPKMWKGKEWHWCSPKTGGKCTGQHRRHKPSECEGKSFRFEPKTPANEDESGGSDNKKPKPDLSNTQKRKLKLAKALTAAIPMSEDDSE